MNPTEARGAQTEPQAPPGAIEVRVHRSIREIAEDDYGRLLGDDPPPFLSRDFLDVLERTACVGPKTGWMPHHVTLHEGDRLVAIAPGYLKGNSEGEFVFDHAWAGLAERLGVAYYPKLVFAVPFTPATGSRFLCAEAERPRLLPIFAAAVRRLVDVHEISSAHVLFPPADDAELLAKVGLAHRHGIQFHWRNQGYKDFDQFLGTFKAKRRHQLRRERRELEQQGIRIETHTGEALTPDVVDTMYDFYTRTVKRFYWGRQYLNRAFFEEICARLRGSVEIVLARDGNRAIAGAFNLFGARTLYGRYWGASEERPFLHFNVCYYHSIDECIARGAVAFEPGAGGEHKVVRGFEPSITHSLHHLADPRIDHAVRDFLVRERDAVRRAIVEGAEG